MRIAAIVLIVLGVIALAYGGISYTREKKVLDIGMLEATTKERKTIRCLPSSGLRRLRVELRFCSYRAGNGDGRASCARFGAKRDDNLRAAGEGLIDRARSPCELQ